MSEKKTEERTDPTWMEVGPGAAKGEVIRVRNFASGGLAAVVVQTKGYKPTSVTNPDPREEIIVISERTIALTFLPGVRFEQVPVSSSEAGAATQPTPPRTGAPSSPVPAQAGA